MPFLSRNKRAQDRRYQFGTAGPHQLRRRSPHQALLAPGRHAGQHAARWTLEQPDRRGAAKSGPGATLGWMPLSFVPWERDFVVVQWDQPGAGKSFGAAGRVFDRSLTIDSMAADGLRVAEYLRNHLRQDRIILVGWSWGSVLSLHMIKARPDLFAAYVGTGQVVNMQEGEALAYSRVLEKARTRGDTDAVAELEQIGPPPYDALRELGVQRKWATAYEGYSSNVALLLADWLLAPRASLTDIYDFVTGLTQSQNHFLERT